VSLTIHTEEDDQRQLLVTVEVDEDRVQKAMRSVARELAKEIHVPGFRKGKAPYQVILRRVGEESLRGEAVEKLAQPVFEEMMDELAPDIYSQASLDDIQDQPLVMKYTIPLTPTVELGNYRDLRREVEKPEASEKAIEQALEKIRERHQILEVVDRPAAAGDVVTLSGLGRLLVDEDWEDEDWEDDEADDEEEVETAVSPDDTAEEYDDEYEDDDEYDDDEYDKTLFDEDHTELLMDSSVIFPGTPFIENLIGLSAGEEKNFLFTFPADYEDGDLSGRTARFDVRLEAVKNRTLPELDDELAQKEGSYETAEELRQSVRQELQEQAESRAKNELIEQMIDQMLEDARIVYPPSAVDNEIDSMVESLKNRVVGAGWEWDDYLRLQNLSEDKLREDFEVTAVERLERQLVMQQFIIAEKLQVTLEDMEEKTEEWLGQFESMELKESMRQYIQGRSGFEMLGSGILMDKAFERIQAIYRGEAPDLASLEVDDAAEADEEE
jgi:trigger factor